LDRLYWIGVAFTSLLSIPFRILGAAGFNSRAIEHSIAGKLFKKIAGFVAFVTAIYGLYLAAPNLEINHSPVIACAICDNQQDIHPPTSSHDYGATVTLTIDNTGASATTIIEHNLSWIQIPDTMPLPNMVSEEADANDKLEIAIGSRSSKNLQKAFNEALIYELRHPLPIGSTIGARVQDKAYLFGYVKYRMFFVFSARTDFCFKYIPAYKGLPESWEMCSNEVQIKR
jgi:hypothetical protein